LDTPKQKALHVISALAEDSTWDDIISKLQSTKNDRKDEAVDWDQFVRQVRTILYDEFPEAEAVKLDLNKEDGKISGYIVCKDFNGMEDADRQDQLWDVLEKNLSIAEQSRILSVIALTPDEKAEQGAGIQARL